jgi:Plasmid pRiA4b ORF-3-like protein
LGQGPVRDPWAGQGARCAAQDGALRTVRRARQLRDAGVDRHDILHQLGSVVATHLHGALTNRQAVDPAAYRQALDALQPPSSRRRARSAVAPAGDAVYQVKITLRGAKPPIWRRLRLPAAITLAQLHQVIQVAFGWEDAHLHAFEVGGRRYSRPDFELWDEAADEGKARLRDLAARAGTRLGDTYDFGDSWEHDVLVEKILPSDGVPQAVCLAGRRPARLRTAAGCGAMPSSATSLPTRTILITLNESTGSAAHPTRPPSTRTRSVASRRVV